MLVFGLGLFVGNHLGGKYADKALMPILYITLGAQAIVLFVFNYTVHSQIMYIICIFLMAAFSFSTVSPIQKLVMDKAKEAAGASTLASAVNIDVFNLGNTVGAWFGRQVITASLDFNPLAGRRSTFRRCVGTRHHIRINGQSRARATCLFNKLI
ncbi:MFS transporter [Vibrio vulnificus]|nr:MFS transporter [Vibrio vulnificus]ELX4168600.1 MFS transporter [Vibrio vulnificus]